MIKKKIYCDGAATMKKDENYNYIRCAGGWAWGLIDEDDNLLKRDKPISTSKPIKAINESTLEVFYYKSAREAALILGIDNSVLRKCRNGKLKHYKGCLWQNITMEEYNENINRL